MKMLNVTVKKEFLDRRSGIKHKPGDKLKISCDRLREIKRSGDYVEVEKTASESPAEAERK